MTVNPSALIFNQSGNGSIINRSIAPDPAGSDALGLKVDDGQSLLLVGGDVKLEGGQVNAFGGRVGIGGLAGPGTVGLVFNGSNLSLNFPDGMARADVSLTDGARVDVTSGGGGDITISARDISISGDSTRIFAGIGTGTTGEQAGDITLDATGKVTIVDESRILNRVSSGANGDGGDINVKAQSLSLSGGNLIGGLQAINFGNGDSGNINIEILNGAVKISDGSVISTQVRGTGQGGDITIMAERVDFSDGAELSTSTFEQGSAGNIFVSATETVAVDSANYLALVETGASGSGGDVFITTKNLSLENGAQISASTFGQGDAGSIFVQAFDQVSLDSDSLILSNVEEGAVGNGGDIELRTSALSLMAGSQLTASVSRSENDLAGGQGRGGNIRVYASDSITLSGASEIDGFSSGLFVATEEGAIGSAGSITVNTGAFRVADGAIVNAQTLNQSSAGDITINAKTFEAVNGGQVITTASSSGSAGNIILNVTDLVSLSGSDFTFTDRLNQFGVVVQNEGPNSGLFASTRPGSIGLGGSITVNTGALALQDGARISTATAGLGAAGSITVDTSKSVRLSGRGSGLFANTTNRGSGGDIRVFTNHFHIADGAVIDAQTTANGSGGNILVQAKTANAHSGGQLLTTTTGSGPAGDITFKISDSITLTGNDSGLFASTQPNASGAGGLISVQTHQLTIQDGARISHPLLVQVLQGNSILMPLIVSPYRE